MVYRSAGGREPDGPIPAGFVATGLLARTGVPIGMEQLLSMIYRKIIIKDVTIMW
jgi:hypothetical protein